MSSSLVDDVGRVLWHGFPGPEVTPELHAQIARGQIGAAIVFKRNLRVEAVAGPVPQEVTDTAALIELNRALHAAAPADLPLLIAVDQEGGRVQRFRDGFSALPPLARLGEL